MQLEKKNLQIQVETRQEKGIQTRILKKGWLQEKSYVVRRVRVVLKWRGGPLGGEEQRHLTLLSAEKVADGAKFLGHVKLMMSLSRPMKRKP